MINELTRLTSCGDEREMARKGGFNVLEIRAVVLFGAVFFFQCVVLVDGSEKAAGGGKRFFFRVVVVPPLVFPSV